MRIERWRGGGGVPSRRRFIYAAGALLVGARPRYASILSILPGQQNRV